MTNLDEKLVWIPHLCITLDDLTPEYMVLNLKCPVALIKKNVLKSASPSSIFTSRALPMETIKLKCKSRRSAKDKYLIVGIHIREHQRKFYVF